MKKSFALILALVLVVTAVAGTTLAWLTDTTDEVKNTFKTSDLNVELTETTGNEYKMIPGYEISKDPKATVKADSEECWLFVVVTKSNNFDDYMTYDMADGWELVEGTASVYARKVEAAEGTTVIADDTSFYVLKDNKVTVMDEVTKTMMNALNEDTYPTLTFQVFAHQLNKNATEEFTAADAWANIKAR